MVSSFILHPSSFRKIAFSCPRTVGTKPVRNRYIRKLREFYRLNKDLFPANHFFLLHVRRAIYDWKDFETRLAEQLKSLPL